MPALKKVLLFPRLRILITRAGLWEVEELNRMVRSKSPDYPEGMTSPKSGVNEMPLLTPNFS
jgi:hypothetical protein